MRDLLLDFYMQLLVLILYLIEISFELMNQLLKHVLQLEILRIVFLQLFDRLRLLDVLLPQTIVLLDVLL